MSSSLPFVCIWSHLHEHLGELSDLPMLKKGASTLNPIKVQQCLEYQHETSFFNGHALVMYASTAKADPRGGTIYKVPVWVTIETPSILPIQVSLW